MSAILLATVAAAAAIFQQSILLDVASTWLLSALLAVGWMTFCGPSQEVSLGHALFFGGAGYCAALVEVRAGAGPLAALAVAIIVAITLGALLALLTTRHRGLYFSMVTMALQIAGYRLLFLRSDVFGGEEGLTGIALALSGRVELFVLAGTLLVGLGGAATVYLRSTHGLLLGAIGQNEPLALSLGANLAVVRCVGLMVSGALSGVAGALWALSQGYVSPDLAGEALSARTALLGCIGGLWSVGGAAIASLLWESGRFALSRTTDLAGPVSAAALLLLVARPTRLSKLRRPNWDSVPLRDKSARLPVPVPDRRPGLVLRAVSVNFGGVHPLKQISFSLERGRAMGLVGPNGAGKTTLLSAIAGVTPSQGEILWGARPLMHMDTSARARAGVRKTFQHAARFAEFSVWEHLQVADVVSTACAIAGDARQRLLDMCGPLRGRRAMDLDAGTMRLVELAMALTAPPELLLLDEPFAGLSDSQANAVAEALQALKRAGVTLLIVEHRLADMQRIVDDLVMIAEGHVVCAGPAATVLRDERVRGLYFGA